MRLDDVTPDGAENPPGSVLAAGQPVDHRNYELHGRSKEIIETMVYHRSPDDRPSLATERSASPESGRVVKSPATLIWLAKPGLAGHPPNPGLWFGIDHIGWQSAKRPAKILGQKPRPKRMVNPRVNALGVRASQRKCHPPYRGLFRASRAMAGLSLHALHRRRRRVVEEAWGMRREYCEPP